MTTSTSATDNNNKAQIDPKTDSKSVTPFATINTNHHSAQTAQPPRRKSTIAPPTQQPMGNNKLPASSIAAIATKPSPNSPNVVGLSSELVLGEGTTKQLLDHKLSSTGSPIIVTTDSWKRAKSLSENVTTAYGIPAQSAKGTSIRSNLATKCPPAPHIPTGFRCCDLYTTGGSVQTDPPFCNGPTVAKFVYAQGFHNYFCSLLKN